MIQIRLPELALFGSLKKFEEDMRAQGETIWDGYYPKPGELPGEFIARVRLRETSPEPPLVHETTYWGVLDGEVAGRISIRHRLNENLSKIGGHIGYEVSPRFRRQGVAKEMLRLILLEPKAREIGRLLLTCKPTNPASIRTIVANGGKLEKTIFVDSVGEDRHHFWIALNASSGC